ncbi:hypothetical protein [Pseudomonas sp. D8002]|uniref:hypothetical protein n=1 Tax=Pseudomonas sp. D8002 TaxID=2738816 RepID=UPI00210B9C89|nr:hypothetical protein [Pseudomonas sp. D8002]
MTIAPTQATASFIPLNAPDKPLPPARLQAAAPENAAPGSPGTRIPSPRADADGELAGQVASALRQVKGDGHDDAIMVENIPPNSTFGQWWSQLGRAMESPQVRDWMRENGINPNSVMIDPNTGKITYQRRPSAAAQPNGPDDKGWAQVGAQVRDAARVIGDGNPIPFKPPLSQNSNSAPLWLVSQFYKEQEHILPDHAHERADELARDKAFTGVSGPRFADLHETRGEDEVERQKALVGNTQTLNTVGRELNYLLERIRSGSIGSGDVLDYLQKNKVELHPDSAYRQVGSTDSGSTISLKEFLEINGWDVPTTPEEVENLTNYLLRPELQTPLHGNYGGALEWQPPLAPEAANQLRSDLRRGKIGDVDLNGARNVVEYLMQGKSFTPSELADPQRVLDSLIRSPKGKALGEALQAKFDAQSIKGSATDWLLAAMSVDKDNSFRATDPRSRHHIAGFAVTGNSTWGKPASGIVSRLAEHLVSTGKASSPEAAALQAHLLLSTRAPEFLVKDIPDQVTPGSHSWVSFVTAVERIEAQSPGSTAGMSYGQVMLHAEVAPVSAQERYVEYAAQQEALKDWGSANGMPYPVTEGQMNDVRDAFDAQITELSAASQTQSMPMPLRKEMALEQLRKALPGMDTATLEDKSITLEPAHSDFPGPYSILDLYMKDALHHRPGVEEPPAVGVLGIGPPPPADNHWVTSSSTLNLSEVLEKTKDLPSMPNVFQDAFGEYADGIEKSVATQVKWMVSRLPEEDRKNLEYGEITVVREVDVDKDNFGKETRKRVPDDNCLLVKTRRNNQVHIYEINLRTAKITERTDLGDFTAGKQPSNHTHYHKDLEEVIPSGEYAPGLTDEKIQAANPKSFGSARTSYIADAMVKDVDIRSFKKEAEGLTTLDTEVPFYKKVNEFLLNLIPLRSAIVNFQNGNIGEGVGDLALDIFGFAVGLGAAARGAKAVAAGASAFSKFAQGAKIVGRAALGSFNPLSGADDLARSALKLGRTTLTAGRNGVNHLRGALRSVDLTSLAKKPGIAEGTYKAANATEEAKVFAKFDDATGNWHALNVKTRKPFGEPLENFKADAVPVEALRDKLEKLHAKTGYTGTICYEKTMFVGMADNALPLKTREAVLGSVVRSGDSNYTQRYKDLMGITAENTCAVFRPADITESGVINFMSNRADGNIVHTAYIQKSSDGKLYIYNTNQAGLDKAMFDATGTLDQSVGATVFSLDNDGLQKFLDSGFTFSFTPNSTLNANVTRLAT